MTSRALILLLAFLGAYACHAQQAPPIEWEYTWGGSDGDFGDALDQAADGSIFLGGMTYSNDGDVNGSPDVYGDAWVVKMAQGSIVWQRVFVGNDWDAINAIKATADGGCIVSGFSYSGNGDFVGNHGENDCWMAKLDGDGAVQWSRMLGGSSIESGRGVDLCADGGYVMVGSTGSSDGDVAVGHGNSDAWVVKLDANGDILWQSLLGGSMGDAGSAIDETADGGFLLSGGTYSNDGQVSGNHGDGDGWVARLDQDGQLLWQASIGGSAYDLANAVRECADEGAIVTGETRSGDGDFNMNHGDNDAWVVRLNHRGDIEWSRTLGGAMNDRAYAVTETTEGRFAIAGMTRSNDGDVSGNHGERDMWVVKLDTNGTTTWQKPLGGTQGEEARAMVSAPDGGLIVAGFAMSSDGDVAQSAGYADMWVVKLGPDVVGIDEPWIPVFCVSPNPAQGSVEVRVAAPLRDARITLTDAQGRAILQQPFNGLHLTLDLGLLPRGLYLLSLASGVGSTSQRLVLE